MDENVEKYDGIKIVTIPTSEILITTDFGEYEIRIEDDGIVVYSSDPLKIVETSGTWNWIKVRCVKE
jgi:hypothetical protein